MPPSPALRCSPGRELRGDNHKRGRSLEGRILYGGKDDDLTLFNEMETREKDNFLLTDDFEDILSSKFRYFSSDTLGVSIPTRGESSDLLNAEADKNDYDWLLTPPDTPLFRSLDDETPAVTVAERGRPRSKPITISRSSTMEKSYVSSRGSASPNRLSISPRSANSTIQSRPSSAPRSSPTCTLRGTTPPRRPSPPPRKPSMPGPRSSTPTSRRPTSASSSFGKRTPSPINKTRGNSSSPKTKPWQTNIPGFSLEAPPNLRTSIGDRPSSYIRGSSPARQSMSPRDSRSASSSHSHRGSIASSGDDDADSILSIPMNKLDQSGIRRAGVYTSSHSPSLSRKSTRPGTSSSAPKRSFESALRQMDHHRKVPQNMFRPLLSSVPTSTFYVGKSTSGNRSLISRNSSVTTSSNTSSDPSPAGAHDDIASSYEKSLYADKEEDIFPLENTDTMGEDVSSRAISGGARISQNNDPLSCPMLAIATPEITDAKGRIVEENNSNEDKTICSECGRVYHGVEFSEGELNLCPDCRSSDKLLIITSSVEPATTAEISQNLSMKLLDNYISVDALEPSSSVLVTSTFMCDGMVDEIENSNVDLNLNLSTQISSEKIVAGEKIVDQSITVHSISSDGDKNVHNIDRLKEIPSQKLDISEGTGISILLKRSTSAKGPFLQSRSFTATSISFDDLSYVRDCQTSMRSSTSSLDITTKHRRSGSSLSGNSNHTFHGLGVINSEIIAISDNNESGKGGTKFDDDCDEIICHDDGETVPANILNKIGISFPDIDDSGSYRNGEDLQNDSQSINGGEVNLLISDGDAADPVEIPTHSLLETISEIEIENGHPGSPDSQSDVGSSNSSEMVDELQELSTSTRSDKDVAALVEECDFLNHKREESTVTVELGTKSKSLTLEEATDAILFCSSIVHNLAYEAAKIAIEKENTVSLEGSLPSVTILGNSNFDNRKEPRGRTVTKRTPKSQKTRKRRMETDIETKTKPLSGKESVGTYEKSATRIVGVPDRGDSMNPPKLESKCNCTIM